MNGFYVGSMPDELPSLTIPERMVTQHTTSFSVARVMRGGQRRCIRSHCVAIYASPGSRRWCYGAIQGQFEGALDAGKAPAPKKWRKKPKKTTKQKRLETIKRAIKA
ncbi:hypothetical protein JG688_00007227 [Phytophthora aleatoria]|uniref:DUF6570 domain-containing protein n=1 Tax=Phytophthora aleatoria TaxID=2496075 RepID=A0A8J5J699_9STRA|nr:hypothetical protein JG688_00007227 [Phytophthora aleatoria]